MVYSPGTSIDVVAARLVFVDVAVAPVVVATDMGLLTWEMSCWRVWVVRRHVGWGNGYSPLSTLQPSGEWWWWKEIIV